MYLNRIFCLHFIPSINWLLMIVVLFNFEFANVLSNNHFGISILQTIVNIYLYICMCIYSTRTLNLKILDNAI